MDMTIRVGVKRSVSSRSRRQKPRSYRSDVTTASSQTTSRSRAEQ